MTCTFCLSSSLYTQHTQHTQHNTHTPYVHYSTTKQTTAQTTATEAEVRAVNKKDTAKARAVEVDVVES